MTSHTVPSRHGRGGNSHWTRARQTTLWTGALAALALFSAAPSLAQQPSAVSLPPISDPASQTHQPGRIVWLDLVTPDVGAAERFYGGLFGWSFQSVQAGEGRRQPYVIAMADGHPVAGLLQRSLPQNGQRHGGWLAFISTGDADAASHSALANGGRQRAPLHDYPQRGQQQVLEDPQGVAFGVVASSSGDPPDELASPGHWIWSALFTTDPDHAAAFYQDVFGYEVYDLTDQSDLASAQSEPNAQPHAQATATDSSASAAAADAGVIEHLELASQGYARASINGLPADGGQHRAHWLHFVRVDDAAAAAAQAERLGAHVLVPARGDRQGGRVAVIADPSGALLGLMEWSDSDDTDGAAHPGTGPTPGTGPAVHGANAGAAAPASPASGPPTGGGQAPPPAPPQ